jgi:hypothetical protein
MRSFIAILVPFASLKVSFIGYGNHLTRKNPDQIP